MLIIIDISYHIICYCDYHYIINIIILFWTITIEEMKGKYLDKSICFSNYFFLICIKRSMAKKTLEEKKHVPGTSMGCSIHEQFH